MMKKCFPASPARVNGSYAKLGQMNGLTAQDRDCKNRQGPGHSQEPREICVSTASTSSATPRSHQRRWSADFRIIVKKNKKEPQPPQRGVSLLRPHIQPHPSAKRYSCPSIGVFGSPRHTSSSSSSTSTSSCSSPPPVQTSVITGHDPLGWKLRPKSSSTSPRAQVNRLSLQIPLPVIFPDPEAGPAPNSQSDNTPNRDPSPKTKPPLRPKPSRRHHSDSSAFLRSLATPLPVVTVEELAAVHLHPVTLSDDYDDVFSEGNEGKVTVTTRSRKVPPPVPEKTSMARQIAQLIALSRQCCQPVTAKANKENLCTSVIKPKPKYSNQAQDHSSRHARKPGLRVDTSCDRERSTPRFPG